MGCVVGGVAGVWGRGTQVRFNIGVVVMMEGKVVLGRLLCLYFNCICNHITPGSFMHSF